MDSLYNAINTVRVTTSYVATLEGSIPSILQIVRIGVGGCHM